MSAAVLAPCLSVGEQRDAVRPERPLHPGLRRDERFDDVGESQHGGGEDVDSCATLQEEFGDAPLPDMGRRTERGLPVTEAPIPPGIHEGRIGLDQFPDAGFIAVRLADDFGHELDILSRKAGPQRGLVDIRRLTGVSDG